MARVFAVQEFGGDDPEDFEGDDGDGECAAFGEDGSGVVGGSMSDVGACNHEEEEGGVGGEDGCDAAVNADASGLRLASAVVFVDPRSGHRGRQLLAPPPYSGYAGGKSGRGTIELQVELRQGGMPTAVREDEEKRMMRPRRREDGDGEHEYRVALGMTSGFRSQKCSVCDGPLEDARYRLCGKTRCKKYGW